MHLRYFSLLATFALLWVASTAALAQDRRVFGLGQPESIAQLPPGPLRSALEGLPPRARGRALGLLQGTTVPVDDIAFMRADRHGNIFYVDLAFEANGEDGGVAPPAAISESQVFLLHSRPGAANVLYVDFDGHDLINTVWNGYSGQSVLQMRPYSADGDYNSFSTTELDRIAEAWRRVAEDFAPFDIDVTTEEPPFTINASNGRIEYGSNVGHILITNQQDTSGAWVYTQGGCGCGGVAYYNGFGNSYLSPGLVFNTSLNGVSEAISHEFGHNLYLSHDGQSPGDGSYYLGHGAGAVGWAPIMGASYYVEVTQWSQGEYLNANNSQDDMAQIASKLSYRNDDHEDTNLNLATPLLVTSGTIVASDGRVTDPTASDPANRGIIKHRNDRDLFSMDVGAGTIDLVITPAHLETYVSGRRSNLDIQARLLDGTGTVLQSSNPDLDIDARITYVVTAPGTYYLEIDGVGRGDPLGDGYTDYASVGEYFINGTVPEAVVVGEPPTAPDPVTALLVDAVNIELSWLDPATPPEADEAGYRVLRSVNGGAFTLHATLPRDSEFFADNNLANGTYAYMLELFNSVGTALSDATDAIFVDAPTVAVATGEVTTAGSIQSGSYLDTQVPAGSETLVERHSGGKPQNRRSFLEHTWTVTGVLPGATVTLYVSASVPSNAEQEDFLISYSVNGGPWLDLGEVLHGTGVVELTADLGALTSGSVQVKVVDSDPNTAGNGDIDSLTVHEIRITSAGSPGDQPPLVSITSPADGSIVAPGTLVTFSATVEDEDTGLESLLVWTYDGNQALGSGASFAATLPDGEHTVTATVTDSASNTSQDSITVTVTDAPQPTDLAVAGLDGFGEPAGKGGRWQATVSVEIRDDLGHLVAGAQVSGTWIAGTNGAGSCTTDAEGLCLISKGGLKGNVGAVTFAIDTVGGPLPYDPGDNVATMITVTAP